MRLSSPVPRGFARSCAHSGWPSRHILRSLLALVATAAIAAPTAADSLYPRVPNYTGYESNATWAQYPPESGRGFSSHAGVALIQGGLPPGSGIYGTLSFISIAITSETPGGPLGGETTLADASARFEMRGTGLLAGYTRTLLVPVSLRLYTGPQVAGAAVRIFAVDVDQLFGQVILDPDFDLLRIVAGTGFGMPSPGRAILTRDGTGDFLVDSYWDLMYRVDFVGKPGGTFGGMSGSTVSEHRQRAGMHTTDPCTLPDNGSGTANWTPFCIGWRTKTETMLFDAGQGSFLIGNLGRRPNGLATFVAGGPFAGEQTTDLEDLVLEIVGEGGFAGYNRVIVLPINAQHDLGPKMFVDPFQGRISDPQALFAQLAPGDPDFDLLRIVGGAAFGYTDAGHTTLTRGGGTNWELDSFFDATYRVDVVGHPGGPFTGYSGSTNAETRGQAGRERPGYCLVPANGSGSSQFPPFCPHGYRSPRHVRGIVDGLPVFSPVLADIEIIPLSLVSAVPGGSFGGETQSWTAKVVMTLTGQGAYAGYTRTLSFAANVNTDTAPIVPGSNPQHFETDLTSLAGQLPFGDPDFDLLRIAGGTSFGMPSPGFTSLTHAGVANYNTDSFFDITYRIDFIGAIGGPFAGRSGSTNDRQRFLNGEHPGVASPPRPTPIAVAVSAAMPNPTTSGARVTLELPQRAAVRAHVYDIAGRLVRVVEDGTREAGVRDVSWDGAGAAGTRVSPGLYLLRVDVDGVRFARRVLVTR